MLIASIQNRYLTYRRAKALKNIRAFFADFGYDVSGLTDEEMENKIIKVQKRISSIGFSAGQASISLSNFAKLSGFALEK